MRRFWWQTYFWSIGLLAAGAIVYDVYAQPRVQAFDVVDYATWIISLAGVFGFAYSKTILHKRVWQVWLPLAVGWDLVTLARQYSSAGTDPVSLVFVLVIVGLLFVPEYVALYLYGYRSDSLWSARS